MMDERHVWIWIIPYSLHQSLWAANKWQFSIPRKNQNTFYNVKLKVHANQVQIFQSKEKSEHLYNVKLNAHANQVQITHRDKTYRYSDCSLQKGGSRVLDEGCSILIG